MNDNVVFLLSYIPTPLIFMAAGLMILRFPPGYGESVGYRTKLSRSSEQAWDFAQVFWGRLAVFSSIPVFVISMAAGIVQLLMNADENTGLIICYAVVTLQLVPIFVSIGVTESTLKKNFG